MNYNKLINHNPFVIETITNSKGQTIELVEHPTLGDTYEVIAICHELKKAKATDFFEVTDMIAEHGEYEPYFNEQGELEYGR